MDTKYADAIVSFADGVASLCARAIRAGLSNKELAEELRRIAGELETEGASDGCS